MNNKSTLIDGIDYGPLAIMAGTWQGDKGMDISPEPDGTEKNPYYETIVIKPIGDLDNVEEQQILTALHYHLEVFRKSNDELFHHETGYWIWDASSEMIMKTLSIPRAVSLVAGGQVDASGKIIVEAKLGDENFGIVEQPFMRMNASTKTYKHEVEVKGDEMTYSQTMLLDIYGTNFDHTDINTLKRV